MYTVHEIYTAKPNKTTKNTLVISKGKHWEQRKQQNEMVGNNGNKGTNSVCVIDSMNNLIQ